VPDRPRILVLEGGGHVTGLLQTSLKDCDVVRADTVSRALALLREQNFDAFCADSTEPALREQAGDLARGGRLLDALADGVAVVGADLRIVWGNPAFAARCGDGTVRGRGFYDALCTPEILGPDYSPFHTALAGRVATTRLRLRDDRYLELHVTPMSDPGAAPSQLIVLARDVTAEVLQQHKLDALHKAGAELAALAPDQLADMCPEERVELLKQDIRRLTHDLLHYDVIEIRLLDCQTGRLEPLLEEGMTPEAARRALYPTPQGNGVTGFVAATGKSYLCGDAANDPLYLQGAAGARSSLTVPLLHEDQVIGTFNVESPTLHGFGEQDLQFAEIFCREIASALHTLELLSAEKHSTATRSVEAIGREVALPVDDILTAATAVLDRYIGHDPEMAAKLRQILAGARAIKQSIQKVGEEMVPSGRAPVRSEDGTRPRLKGKRVLIADNDERVRKSGHGLLGRWGCVVETARDAQEAIVMARLGTYDYVLADIRLPDRPGYEVYRELRQAQPQARVILMTAYGYDPSHTLVKARQDGLRFVLYKPFRIDQLLAALEGQELAPAKQPEVVQT
jgi:CheY-like chemotaxis protein/PAS domain-containing protein